MKKKSTEYSTLEVENAIQALWKELDRLSIEVSHTATNVHMRNLLQELTWYFREGQP